MEGEPLDRLELLAVRTQRDHPERQANWLLLLNRALLALRVAATRLALASMKYGAMR